MAEKPSEKKKKNKHPELEKSQKKQTTKIIQEKSQDQEEKPSFQELLPKEEKSASSPPGLIGIEKENLEDENILEICKDIIAIPFDIWNKLNPGVKPLSESEKKHISQPLARIVVKYDVAKYMKDEFVLFTFLGFSIYQRAKVKKVKKNDVDNNREKREGKDYPHEKPITA